MFEARRALSGSLWSTEQWRRGVVAARGSSGAGAGLVARLARALLTTPSLIPSLTEPGRQGS